MAATQKAKLPELPGAGIKRQSGLDDISWMAVYGPAGKQIGNSSILGYMLQDKTSHLLSFPDAVLDSIPEMYSTIEARNGSFLRRLPKRKEFPLRQPKFFFRRVGKSKRIPEHIGQHRGSSSGDDAVCRCVFRKRRCLQQRSPVPVNQSFYGSDGPYPVVPVFIIPAGDESICQCSSNQRMDINGFG